MINKIFTFFSNTFYLLKNYLNLYFSIFIILLFINLLGNLPFTIVRTNFYCFRIRVSLTIWVSLLLSRLISLYDEYISHLLPYGAPIALMILLPLIEIISQILRPLTLSVRISTNLAAGHIIVFIFSYFITLIRTFTRPFIGLVILILQVLELGIRILQAYIFITLLIL